MSERMRDVREIVRDEMAVRDRLLALLEEGPKTVPELAAALGVPSHEVMHWVMAARRYGHLGDIIGGRPLRSSPDLPLATGSRHPGFTGRRDDIPAHRHTPFRPGGG